MTKEVILGIGIILVVITVIAIGFSGYNPVPVAGLNATEWEKVDDALNGIDLNDPDNLIILQWICDREYFTVCEDIEGNGEVD